MSLICAGGALELEMYKFACQADWLVSLGGGFQIGRISSKNDIGVPHGVPIDESYHWLRLYALTTPISPTPVFSRLMIPTSA